MAWSLEVQDHTQTQSQGSKNPWEDALGPGMCQGAKDPGAQGQQRSEGPGPCKDHLLNAHSGPVV